MPIFFSLSYTSGRNSKRTRDMQVYHLLNCKVSGKSRYHKIHAFRCGERVERYLYKFTNLNAKWLDVYSKRETELHMDYNCGVSFLWFSNDSFSCKEEWLRKGCYLDLWVIKKKKTPNLFILNFPNIIQVIIDGHHKNL